MLSLPPLPPEITPTKWRRFLMWLFCLGLFLTGLVLGFMLAPESPSELSRRLHALEAKLVQKQQRIGQLEETLRQADTVFVHTGHLQAVDKRRHEEYGRRYAAALRRAQAQGAADLMLWFVGRWNELLDHPQVDDRTSRRAAVLSLLVGGMAANISPSDFVPWQAEFLNGHWLGDLHFDLDADGLPGLRSNKNTHDGFANVSVCHVAMALNQSVLDARILMMPEMHCDRPEARMSVFLQGRTFDEAIDEFVRAVREQGFLVVERLEQKIRLVLVGMRPSKEANDR